MSPTYLTITATGVYKYRRRTPQELQQYIVTKEIIRSLGKDQSDATKKAIELNQVIDQAILVTKMPTLPSSIITDLLDKHNLSSINGDLSTTKDTKSLSRITKLFLDKAKVSSAELENMTYVYNTLLPTSLNVLFKSPDPDINTVTYDKLLKIIKLVEKLPNRNYKEYRQLNLADLMSHITKGTLVIPREHLMSPVTINNQIKRIKSLLLFAQQLKVYDQTLPRVLTKDKTQGTARDYKAVLAHQELSKVFSGVTDDNLQFIYKVLYYSGMRRSELYKCKVSEIDDVLCFDLRSPKENLKTKSSYRVIPVHTQLMDKVDQFESIVSSVKPDRMTKVFTRITKAHLSDPNKKSLYSLRHTFATDLIAKGVQAEIVSEILGHQHSTMTLNRYVKGYPVATLKSAIDSL